MPAGFYSEALHRYTVRKILGFEIVWVDGEHTLAVFRDGRCLESGLPNFNAARAWCIAKAKGD